MLELEMHQSQMMRQQGKKIKDIAERLGKCERTIHNYLAGPSRPRKKRHYPSKLVTVKTTAPSAAADVVLTSFSEAIDAVDRDDVAVAKEKLQTVQKVDKTNEAARYYMNKLQALSPKFRVETVGYTSPYSSGSLGFIDKMKIYSWGGASLDPPWIETEHGGAQLNGDYWVQDKVGSTFWGVALPLGSRFGLGAGVVQSGQDLKAFPDYEDPPELSLPDGIDMYNEDSLYTGIQSFLNGFGGYLSLGVRITDWMSFGTSVMGWHTSAGAGSGLIVDEGFFFSVYPGLAFQIPGTDFSADINFAYTSFTMYYVDFDSSQVLLGNLPLVIDASVTYGLFDQHLFLGLKGISDIYYDTRGGHALRIIPMAEVWPLDFLSIRAGYEYSHLSQAGSFTIGHGAVGGITLKIWKLDINANLTYRRKPVQLLPGYDVENMKLLIGLEFNPDWMMR